MSPRRHRAVQIGRELTRETVPQHTAGQEIRPEWRNGRRAGLKIRWGQPRVSSNLTSGMALPDNEWPFLTQGSVSQASSSGVL